MIDPKDVVRGLEYLSHVLCAGCGRIPLKLNLKECDKCRSIICDDCFHKGKSANEDLFY